MPLLGLWGSNYSHEYILQKLFGELFEGSPKKLALAMSGGEFCCSFLFHQRGARFSDLNLCLGDGDDGELLNNIN